MSQPISALNATSAKRETSEPVQPSPKRFKNATSTKETPHEETVEKTVLAIHDLPLDMIMEVRTEPKGPFIQLTRFAPDTQPRHP